MTERTRLISCLLYGLFSAGKKNRKRFPISACVRKRSFEATFTEQRKPWPCDRTRRDSKNSFFENEVIFAFITPRSRSNLTLKFFFIYNAQSLQENNNPLSSQSERTYYCSHIIISHNLPRKYRVISVFLSHPVRRPDCKWCRHCNIYSVNNYPQSNIM